MLSSDVSGTDPNYPQVMEKRNSAILAKEQSLINIYSGGKSNSNDANAEYIVITQILMIRYFNKQQNLKS